MSTLNYLWFLSGLPRFAFQPRQKFTSRKFSSMYPEILKPILPTTTCDFAEKS
jgi:hypothetical protein